MDNPAATLESTIELLRPYGSSVLLVRCLVLAGRWKDASAISQHLAPVESIRLSNRRNDPVTETAELYLRSILCHVVGGSRRNARIHLMEFIRKAEDLKSIRSDDHGALISKLAIGALLVADRASAERVIDLDREPATLMIRVLRAWLKDIKLDLASYANELKSYVEKTGLPIWSDTWHHLILKMITGELNLCGDEART